MKELIEKIPEIEKKIDYTFKDRSLLELSFVHRSYINENKKIDQSNERLEFLGDSILNLVVTEYLYKHLPKEEEGFLSAMRASLVNSLACAQYLKKLALESYVLLGRGEQLTGGGQKESILADTFEAVIGAIFLDGGIEKAKEFLLHHFKQDYQKRIHTPHINHKAMLQVFCQKKYKITPHYVVLKEEGPPHEKIFHVAACIDKEDPPSSEELGKGIGPSKKEAEAKAAEDALKKLGEL